MIITKIKQIGKTNRYHVYVDEEWFGIFLDETLAMQHLRTNQEIEDEKMLEIKKENDERISFALATSYMEKYVTSEKGIRDYLKKKAFADEIIDRTVEKLKSYGFVDDEKFAKNYFESMSAGKGKRAIANKLRQKGISKEIVDDLLENVDDDSQLENAISLAKKFLKNRQNASNLPNKCLAHLIYKGYDYSVAQKATQTVLKTYEGEKDDWF